MRSLFDLLQKLLTIMIVGALLALFRQRHRWLYFPLSSALSIAGGFMATWVPFVMFSERGTSDAAFFNQAGWFLPVAILFTGWLLGRIVCGIQEWLFEGEARIHTRFWEPLYGVLVVAVYAVIIWQDLVWLGFGLPMLAAAIFVLQLGNSPGKQPPTDEELYEQAMQDPAIRDRAASMSRDEVIALMRQMRRLDNRTLKAVSTVRAKYVR